MIANQVVHLYTLKIHSYCLKNEFLGPQVLRWLLRDSPPLVRISPALFPGGVCGITLKIRTNIWKMVDLSLPGCWLVTTRMITLIGNPSLNLYLGLECYWGAGIQSIAYGSYTKRCTAKLAKVEGHFNFKTCFLSKYRW